ncbi:MAG: A/G-specific adenine glycosylase [Alphaproteobacteria bacterium]|nr:A/G-specific adenine glycosylase [Alphaproteobacteria bacterium]
MTDKESKNKKKTPRINPVKLLAWYDRHARVLPWRAPIGKRADPYHVWLSEIMLQQTTVTAVAPYFIKFLGRWPTLADLAAASLDEVFQMWAGLGYYRRARGLHACAQTLVKEYDGVFPSSEDDLLKLSGIGPYTAAAIAAIAFDQRANVVDGNVERVMARLYNVETPLPKAKKEIKEHAAQNLPTLRYGDYAQALMDLGATVCTPRNPKCAVCPWQAVCQARILGCAEDLPVRLKAKPKPKRYATAFVLRDSKGRVLLRQRPPEGLLASMMEVPSTPWQEGKGLVWEAARRYAPIQGAWTLLSGNVYHTFTHFDLELCVAVASGAGRVKGKWVKQADWETEALPSVMKKILVFAEKEMRIRK